MLLQIFNFFLSLSIKLTVSFFASKTPLATFTGLIYSSHFALTGFEFSLAPLAGLVGGVRNFRGGGKKKTGRRKSLPKTAVAPRRIATLLASLSAWLSSPVAWGFC